MSSVIFLDVPTGLELSFDLVALRVTPDFKGFIQIPPGFHYISYATDDGAAAGRQSLLAFLMAGETLVYRWETDKLVACQEYPLVAAAIQLVPYPQERVEDWCRLTSHISLPSEGSLFSPLDLQRPPPPVTLDEPSELTGSRLTSFAFDKSSLLENLLSDPKRNLLGEFQLAFLNLTLGLNFSAFEHWRDILLLACKSTRLLQEEHRLGFFADFLMILRVQVAGSDELGRDLFEALFKSADTPRLISDLNELVGAAMAAGGRTWREAEMLARHVKARFSWDLREAMPEPDEDLPVIVGEV